MRANAPERLARIAAVFLSVVAALLATGCGGGSSITIQPAAPGNSDDAAPGLGPGIRPLSFGPGEKGYISFHPSEERLAFVVDGYVAEKTPDAQGFERLTDEDFDASGAEWINEDNLMFVGRRTAGENASEPAEDDSLYLARRGDDGDRQTRLVEVSPGVEAADALPGGGFVAAVSAGEDPTGVGLVTFKDRVKPSPGTVRGRIVGLSASPDGSEAALAIDRDGGDVELLSYDLKEGTARRVALLPDGHEVLGSPQWTEAGIHYIASKDGMAPYTLYRAERDSEEPEQVQGVGEGFLPAGIEASPDGEKLAVVGRRNASSPTDLYVLSLDSGTLEAVTENEDMEIKTGQRDISWTPDGSGVVLIARVALPEPEVYDAPARSLAPAFFNLYLAPVAEPR